MNTKAYPGNISYELLIYLLIKYAITELNPMYLKALNTEAQAEIKNILDLNKKFLKEFAWDKPNPVKLYNYFYRLARIFDSQKSEKLLLHFPSLFAIVACQYKDIINDLPDDEIIEHGVKKRKAKIFTNKTAKHDASQTQIGYGLKERAVKIFTNESSKHELRPFDQALDYALHPFYLASNYEWIKNNKYILKTSLELLIGCIIRNNNNLKHPEIGMAPIHIASALADATFLEQFISLGISINKRDKKGYVPFHYACQFGNYLAAQYLIEKASNVNISAEAAFELLKLACQADSKDCVALILKIAPHIPRTWKNELYDELIKSGQDDISKLLMLNIHLLSIQKIANNGDIKLDDLRSERLTQALDSRQISYKKNAQKRFIAWAVILTSMSLIASLAFGLAMINDTQGISRGKLFAQAFFASLAATSFVSLLILLGLRKYEVKLLSPYQRELWELLDPEAIKELDLEKQPLLSAQPSYLSTVNSDNLSSVNTPRDTGILEMSTGASDNASSDEEEPLLTKKDRISSAGRINRNSIFHCDDSSERSTEITQTMRETNDNINISESINNNSFSAGSFIPKATPGI